MALLPGSMLIREEGKTYCHSQEVAAAGALLRHGEGQADRAEAFVQIFFRLFPPLAT